MNLVRNYNFIAILIVSVNLSTLVGCASNVVKNSTGLKDSNNIDPKMLVQKYLPTDYCLLSGFNLTRLYPLFGNVKSIHVKTSNSNYLYTFNKQLNITEIKSYSEFDGTSKCIFTYDKNYMLAEIVGLTNGVVDYRHKILYERNGLKALLFSYNKSGELNKTASHIIEYQNNPKSIIYTIVELNFHTSSELDSNNSIIKDKLYNTFYEFQRDQNGRFLKRYVARNGKNKYLDEWCDNKDLDIKGNVQRQACYAAYERFGKEYREEKSNSVSYIRYSY